MRDSDTVDAAPDHDLRMSGFMMQTVEHTSFLVPGMSPPAMQVFYSGCFSISLASVAFAPSPPAKNPRANVDG